MLILSIKGENNTGKSSIGLSFPKKLLFQDLDPGGFERAASRYPEEVTKGHIIRKRYPMPKEMLRIAMTNAKTPRLRGLRELWEKWVDDFCDALEDSKVATIQIDTFSQLYSIACDALLQQKQEAQEVNGKLPKDSKYREQLLQIEYKDVNTRMKAIFDQARTTGTNIVIVHHMSDVYGDIIKDGKKDTGVIGRNAKGWKNCGYAASDLADIVLHTKQKKVKDGVIFTGEFVKAPPALMGQVMDMPTYDDTVSRLKLLGMEV